MFSISVNSKFINHTYWLKNRKGMDLNRWFKQNRIHKMRIEGEFSGSYVDCNITVRWLQSF